ncbi:MAG: DUF4349 domain-containing protein [Flavobacteriales bacterium]|nr:DUF4349 domain-containing protein [Flavobacteriales bacterium]
MNRLLLLTVVVLFTTFTSCENDHAGYNTSEAGYMADESNGTERSDQVEQPQERKLIKEGNVAFETTDLRATRNTIVSATSAYRGYIASEREYNTHNGITNTITVRVPSASFDAFLADATQGVSKFDSKNISVQDVTEQYIDIEGRIKAKRELEARYLQVLEKANTIADILEIEKQLGVLRADLESIEGRLQYLQNQVGFSTLTFTFYEDTPEQSEFGKKIKNGFKSGWQNFVGFIIGLTYLWPFILLLILGTLWFARWRKRKRNSKKNL